MRKTLPLFLLFCLSFFTTSVFAQNVQKNDVLGGYVGSLEVTLMGATTPMDNVEVFAENQDDEHFKLTLKDFTFPVSGFPVNIGDIEVPNVKVNADGTIEAPETIIDKEYLGLGKLPTTVAGTMNGNKANLNIKVTWLTYPIDVVFAGVKKTESSLNKVHHDVKIAINNGFIEVSGITFNQYAIYGINGTLVSTGTNNLISVNSLHAGIYMLQLNTKAGIITKKFIIQ